MSLLWSGPLINDTSSAALLHRYQLIIQTHSQPPVKEMRELSGKCPSPLFLVITTPRHHHRSSLHSFTCFIQFICSSSFCQKPTKRNTPHPFSFGDRFALLCCINEKASELCVVDQLFSSNIKNNLKVTSSDFP